MRRSLLLLVVLMAVLTSPVRARATIAAASCSRDHVNTALLAAIAGDTVTIPACAGGQSWTTGINMTLPANLTILGAGSLSTTGGGDQTVLIDNIASSSTPMFVLAVSGTFRMAGITFKGGTGLVKDSGIVVFSGSTNQFRFDHNHVDRRTYTPQNTSKLLTVAGNLYGVIDHNSFSFGSKIGWIHFVNGTTATWGDTEWAAATGFGGANFMFVEDNVTDAEGDTYWSPAKFTATMSDCHTGGRFVLRYNTLSNTALGQTHPTGHSGGDDRGCRAHEIYGNVITTTGANTDSANLAVEYNNSGPALFWGNTFGQMFNNIMYFNSIRRDNSTYSYSVPPNGWGYCGTEFNGTGSAWDRNDTSLYGAPCIDQPGRGIGNLLTGSVTTLNRRNSVSGIVSWPNQVLEPVYEWSNIGEVVAGSPGTWVVNYAPTRLVQNRDFYIGHGNTSCEPNALACTAGVGVGTLAQIPANCTTGSETGGGVAWWATDQGGNWHASNGTANDGALYKCTATNTWTLYYTPYSYPHPLVSGTAPAAPTNVRIR